MENDKIHHISFDFWDTLATRTNNDFFDARVNYIAKRFDLDPDLVQYVLKWIKTDCEQFGEKYWTCVPLHTQIALICQKLEIDFKNVYTILEEFDRLFYEFPPTFIGDIEFLKFLKSKGKSMSITCNTGLVSGNTIYNWLYDKQLSTLFNFNHFSDEMTYFKPNPFICGLILNQEYCCAIKPIQILHVGDNLETDGQLAANCGMQFLHFDKSNMNYKEILNFI